MIYLQNNSKQNIVQPDNKLWRFAYSSEALTGTLVILLTMPRLWRRRDFRRQIYCWVTLTHTIRKGLTYERNSIFYRRYRMAISRKTMFLLQNCQINKQLIYLKMQWTQVYMHIVGSTQQTNNGESVSWVPEVHRSLRKGSLFTIPPLIVIFI